LEWVSIGLKEKEGIPVYSHSVEHFSKTNLATKISNFHLSSNIDVTLFEYEIPKVKPNENRFCYFCEVALTVKNR
jgi:hypothetical protein